MVDAVVVDKIIAVVVEVIAAIVAIVAVKIVVIINMWKLARGQDICR